jgi:hypothetical protein
VGTARWRLCSRARRIERLVAFMRKGPRGAEVESVEVTEEKPEGLAGFNVR